MNQAHEFSNGVLLPCSDGRVVLSLKSSHYFADDVVPADVQGPAAREPAHARHFVNARMIIEYGRNKTEWPELARRFVGG